MGNVYDILVNFKKVAYEFYEWDKDDDIRHLKVIPSVKVSNKCMIDFLDNNVKVKDDFLEKIIDKTQCFCGRKTVTIKYACIIYNDDLSVAVQFDDTGLLIGKSKLLFDEGDDITSTGKEEKTQKINYEIISKPQNNSNLTRRENRIIHVLDKYLKSVYENNKQEEIKYFYLECFNKMEDDYLRAYQRLSKSVLDADYVVINKLRSLIKVLKK